MRWFGFFALTAETNDNEDAEQNHATTLPSVARFRKTNLTPFPQRVGLRGLRFDFATGNGMT